MRLDNHIQKTFSRAWMLLGILVLLFGALAFLPIQSWTPKAHAATPEEIAGADALYRTCTSGPTRRSSEECITQVRQESNVTNYTPGMTGSSLNPDGGYKDAWCTAASTCISGVVYMFTVGLASALAYIGSSVFNIGVQMSLQSAAYSQLFLTSGWGAARDIANMLFIFILISIAVTIIYSAETHGTMKTLAAVVVMALLINFSFFITRVVVDAGNILAVQFYNAIPATPLSQTAQTGSLGALAVNSLGLSPGDKKDLTYHFMEAVKVQKLLGQDSFKKFTDQNGFMTNVIVQITVYIMVGWIFAILALAFFAVGFKFIIRIIILWFVIIAAPLAFAMRAFSSNDIARKLYNEWQSALLKFSFYPAIFLFILLIMIYIMREMGQTGGLVPDIFASLLATTPGSTESAAVGLGTALAMVLIRLGFVVIMLLFGLKAADQLVLHGSSAAEKVTNWASGKVMGWAENRRFAGLAYRSSVGRAANMANKSVEGAKWASQPGYKGWFGTGLRTKVLAPMANKGFGGTRSFPQVLKDRETRLNERKAQLKKITDKEKLTLRDQENKDLVNTLKMFGPTVLTDIQKRRIAGLSEREIAALDLDHLMTITDHATGPTANFWNDRKMRALETLEKHSDADREKVLQTWEAAKAQQTNQPSPPTPQPAPHTPLSGARGGGGGGSNNGTRPFQNLPEIDVMGRDLGRRSRIAPQQTGGLASSWDNLEKRTSIGPELLGLEKALNGVAEVAARAEARAAAQPPASRTLPINRTQTPVSTAPTKTIPTNMTRSMPVRVSSMNPAQNAPAQTPQAEESHPAAPV